MQSTQRKENEQHFGAVILAAGDSKRLGQPKQLLNFRGKTFIENVIETAIMASLSPIVVVLGYEAEKINELLSRYGKNIIQVTNIDWSDGQSSSLRVAIPFLNNSSHAIFFLVDQPQISSEHIKNLIKASLESPKMIVATYVGDRRANPVSFSKGLYKELAAIHGDQGGRILFKDHEVERLQWDDERILIDVDTLEDYERLKVFMGKNNQIAAIVLAAGESKRMHQSKIVLPWRNGTVISHIVSVLKSVEIEDIVVVTGGYRELVEKEVSNTGARTVHNPDYKNDEMAISLKVGLNSVEKKEISGIFMVLGDQPTIHPEDLRGMIKVHKNDPGKIVIPSYSMHRGHPWLIPEKYYNEISRLNPPDTLRTFIQRNENNIAYFIVDHPEVMVDIDTPEDYERLLQE